MTRNCLNVMRKIAAAKPAFTLPAPTQQELQQAQDQVHKRRAYSGLPIIPTKYDTYAQVGSFNRSPYDDALSSRSLGYNRPGVSPNFFKLHSVDYKPIKNSDLWDRRSRDAHLASGSMFGDYTNQAEDARRYFLQAGEYNADKFRRGYLPKGGRHIGNGGVYAPRYTGNYIKDPEAIATLEDLGQYVR